MTPEAARLRASLLLGASLLFIALTTLAMGVYADQYKFFGNFLSELGATRTWTNRPNHAAMVLFSAALAGLGVAFVAFASTWRAFSCTRTAVRVAGVTAQSFGTLSGLAFVGVAFSPVNLVLDLHNSLVVVAFALLLGYVIAMTVVWACNGAPRSLFVATGTYLVLVLVYFAVVAVAVDAGIDTQHGRELLVISQKCFAYVSMLLVVYVTVATRRLLDRTDATTTG